MALSRRFVTKWAPVLLAVPLGVIIPIITAAFSESKVRSRPFGDAIMAACSVGDAQSLTDFATLVAWNFAPFALLMAIVGILVRHASSFAAWLAFITGMAASCFVFALMYIEAEELLLTKSWTASSLASGFAPLYALAVSAVLAASVGGVSWVIQEHTAPSNSSSS